jgi:hypothetical protein
MRQVTGSGRTGVRAWSALGRVLATTALAMAMAVPVTLLAAAAAGGGRAGATVVPHRPAAGYRLLGGDGGVFSFGSPFEGSAAADPTRCPPNTTDRDLPHGTCWSMATTPTDQGYWILNGYTGAITAYGDAVSYGDRTASNGGGADLWPASIALVPTPSGHGYWMLNVGLSGLGSVMAFGDATFYGDQVTPTPGVHVGVPAGMAATPDGHGYWIVDSDGGVFAYGDASFFGSMGGRPLEANVVDMARTADGGGYWLAAADGGVFAFGDAVFGGSMAGTDLAAPVTGVAADPFGPGYWLVGADGGVFALGGALFGGSMAGHDLAQPVFAISTVSVRPV